MDWEVLIPILFFALPVVISLLDKRAKKQKGVPPVQARPVVFPAQDDARPDGEVVLENRSHPRLRKREGPADEVGGRGPAQPDVFRDDLPIRPEAPSDEGQRAIHREEKEKKVQEEGPQKLEIDKKKLILYSEILKPKYDA